MGLTYNIARIVLQWNIPENIVCEITAYNKLCSMYKL